MELYLSPEMMLSEVQRQFNKVFPFLKIEFIRRDKKKGTETLLQQIIPSHKVISELYSSFAETTVPLDEQMKVAEVERMFEEKFATPVQVFRKSGTVWLETTITDEWTLQQQNDHGRELSWTKAPNNQPDYDLDRDADH